MLLDCFTKNLVEAGCDEAGRGCLAGPVVAAAVIWPRGLKHPELDDSKKLSRKTRRHLEVFIQQHAIAWAVAEVGPREIDEINILNASYLAMDRALEKLDKTPEFVLIDGNRYTGKTKLPFECIIKGDGKYLSIAAASILAKEYRDRLMEKEAEKFPGYKWERNAGYPTPEHKEAIARLGVTDLHRRTFLRKMDQLKLF